VWFVVKRRECCCNLSGGVALIVWFTTNGKCVKNNTIMYVARTSNNRVISSGDLYCCLLPWCKALRTCCSEFLIATLDSWFPKKSQAFKTSQNFKQIGNPDQQFSVFIFADTYTGLLHYIIILFRAQNNC